MRKTSLILLIAGLLCCNPGLLYAQQPGVAINTDGGAPHASAMLDVKSIDKGFLLPRMTQFQRLALTPVNGLLVYETTSERLYQYQDGAWRFFINNSYWARSASRDWVYNGNDSIGIGTAAPIEKLHLNNGNFRLSNGDIKISSGDIFMNKADGTIQLQASAVDKGFVQLSDDDLRLGTNSSNTTGKVVIRTQGANQVAIDDQGIVLVNNGKITKSIAGNNDLLPACYGSVSADGTIISSTTGVTISGPSNGQYYINFPGIGSGCIALITPRDSNRIPSSGYNPGVGMWVGFYDSNNAQRNTAFNFVIFNP